MHKPITHALPWILWIGFCLVLPCRSRCQVLNIEQQRIHTDTIGWSGNARFAFDLVENRDRVIQANAWAHVQRKWARDLILLVGDYGIIRASHSDYSNGGFGHLRYNRKFKGFTAEAFLQGQFNKILRVRFRGLAGAGPRFKLIQGDRLRLYVAFLGMIEQEVEDPTGYVRRDVRMSDYVSWTWNVNDVLTMVHTLYVQPLFADFNDYRVYSQTDVECRIARRFSIAISFQSATDTRPPADAIHSTVAIRNVLSYDFGN